VRERIKIERSTPPKKGNLFHKHPTPPQAPPQAPQTKNVYKMFTHDTQHIHIFTSYNKEKEAKCPPEEDSGIFKL
jgi:hypothetical protein